MLLLSNTCSVQYCSVGVCAHTAIKKLFVVRFVVDYKNKPNFLKLIYQQKPFSFLLLLLLILINLINYI